MNKRSKTDKLRLLRQTLRNLDAENLGQVIGGAKDTAGGASKCICIATFHGCPSKHTCPGPPVRVKNPKVVLGVRG